MISTMSAASFTRSTVAGVNLLKGPPEFARGPEQKLPATPSPDAAARSKPALLRQRQALEGRDAEPICHPGDVVGNALHVVRAAGALRHLLGMLEIVVEEDPDGALYPLVLAARLLPEVDAFEHELSKHAHRLADLLALHDVAGLGRLGHDVPGERVASLRPGRPENLDLRRGQIGVTHDARPQRVVQVVVYVRNPIHEAHHLALEGE